MSFSIIYNKPVHQFKKSGTENSRMIDLLSEVNLSNRLAIDSDEILDNNIDFLKTNNVINILREKSINFLKISLGDINGKN